MSFERDQEVMKILASVNGKGLHSSTFLLNLSHSCHSNPLKPPNMSLKKRSR